VQAAKITFFSIIAFAGSFALVSTIFYFGDWARLIWVSSLGLFIGVVAAPEFDRKAFKFPTTLQAIAGGVAGYLVAQFFGLSPESTVASAGLGGMVGVSASFWVKHVVIP